MGPSVSFPLPPRIAKKLPIPLPMFFYFELIREALEKTHCSFGALQLQEFLVRAPERLPNKIVIELFWKSFGQGGGLCILFHDEPPSTDN